MRKTIHICLSVIDHLGDIGFACELIRSFHEAYPQKYDFIVWTDDLEKTAVFFQRNRDDIGSFDIFDTSHFWMSSQEVLFLLFHHTFPESLPESDILILRIDYLSFDRAWIAHHGSEHIASNPWRQIIEIIPSPLPWSGGLIGPMRRFLDREILAKKYDLDPKKKWVSIFVYQDTLEERLLLENIGGTEVLIFWNIEVDILWMKPMPFISLIEFSSFMRESAWAIVRGEVSLISALQFGTPLLWDMYHEIGGSHTTQRRDFVDWIEADDTYRDLFWKMNSQEKWRLKLSDIDTYFSTHAWKKKNIEKNLVEEIQKYIDSFYISL